MDILYVVSNGKGANDHVAVKQAALTDGSIGQQEVEEIKTGLRAALAAPEARP